MKKSSLTIKRLVSAPQTLNHHKVIIMNMEFDFSFNKLFAVTITYGSIRSVFCRELLPDELHHSGAHFNTIEPNHKKRYSQNEWQKHVNSVIGNFKLEIPEVRKTKPVPRAVIIRKGKGIKK